jgi:hypothetical protein
MANYTNNSGQIRLGWRAAVVTQVVNAVDADATAFISAAGITDLTQAAAISTLVNDLKTYGIWSKMKALYPFVGGNATSHKFNLKDHRDLDAAYRLVFNGGWTHGSTGAKPNGTTAYANTYLSPGTIGMNTSSYHMSNYNRQTSTSGTSRVYIGNETSGVGTNITILGWINGGTQEAGSIAGSNLGSQYSPSPALTTSTTGFKIINTNGSRNARYYKNGVYVPNEVTQSYSFDSNNLFISAINRSGTPASYNNSEHSFTTIGDGLSDTEAANFYISVQKFNTTLGRQVGTPYVSDSDAQAFLNAAVITEITQESAINTLVTDLKTSGVWTKIMALYPFVGGTATSHKFNLKDPRDLDAAYRLVFNGGWIHSPTGAKPNGVNGWADSKFAANILSPGNAHMSYYNRTIDKANGYLPVIQDNSPWNASKTISLLVGNVNNGGIVSIYFAGGGAQSTTVKSTAWTSFTIGSSTATNLYKIYNSGVLQGTSTANSTNTFSTSNLVIGAHDGALNYTNSQETAFVSFGIGLSDSDVVSFNTAVQKYQTTLGRQTDVPLVSDSDAQAFLTAAGITSYTQANAVNTLVVDLKAGGLWTKMKALYPMVGGTSTSHKWNLKDPRDTNDAYRLSFSGGWTHGSTGAKPNGTNAYADTFIVPKNVFNSTTFEHVGYYSRTNTTLTTPPYRYDLGVDNYDAGGNYFGGLSMIIRRDTNATLYSSDYGTLATYRLASTTTSDSLGFFLGSQTGTNIKLYKNNSILSTNTGVSNASYNMLSNSSTRSIWIGTMNELNYTTQNRWTDKETGLISIGEGLNDSEASLLYTAVQKFNTSLGRQVGTPVYNTSGLVLNLDAGNANSYPGTGTTWFDLASGNNGTLVNGPTYDTTNGGSIVFDGVNDYVGLGNTPIFGTSSFTIDMWIYLPTTDSSYRAILSKRSNSNYTGFAVYRAPYSNSVAIQLASSHSGPYFTTSILSTSNSWNHISIIVDRTSKTVVLYSNGIKNTSTLDITNLGDMTNNGVNLNIGLETGIPNWNSKISTTKIYSRVLSEAEVLNNFNSTRGRFGL